MLALLLIACKDPAGTDSAFDLGLDPVELRRVLAMSPPGEPPEDPTNRVAADPAAAALGQALFFDPRFSGNGQVSCASCHKPEAGFADPEPLSLGISQTARHTPHATLSAYNRWQFWDGRADSLWSQALGPLESEVEHGGSRLQYAHVVFEDPALKSAYEAVFGPLPPLDDAARFPAAGRPIPDAPDHPYQIAWSGMRPEDQAAVSTLFANLGKAIAAYERRLVPGPAPIDAFVAALRSGDPAGLDALSAPAQRGLALFVGDAGCHFCHSGPLFSDLEFHNIGLPAPEGATGADPGRYEGIAAVLAGEFNGTSSASDDPDFGLIKLQNLYQGPEHYGQFKTPSLRELSRTAPYMHDGRFSTLEQVIDHYNEANTEPPLGHREEILVPLELDEAMRSDLAIFLEEALRGEPIDAGLTSAP